MERAVATAGRPIPQVDFQAEADLCPSCGGGELGIYKTRTRLVITLAEGLFEARESLKQCDQCNPSPVLGSQRLRRLVKRRQLYGYDLIVHVAMARYVRRLQREEIQAELRDEHGIRLSTGSVTNLCDRFLGYLEALHLKRAPALREAMKGGYPLHVDGSCDRGRGTWLVCTDGWRRWVLLAARIPSENADSIAPVVAKTVELFGDPVATMRDLSDAMAKAVAPLVERGSVDLVCHYHFLAAVGHKLFDTDYSRLRSALRATGTGKALREVLGELRRYRRTPSHKGRFGAGSVRENLLALVLWLLDAEGHKEPSFPFSLPLVGFVQRCRQAEEKAQSWVARPRTEPERKSLSRVMSFVTKMDRHLLTSDALQRLQEGWSAFSGLRDALRLTDDELLRRDPPPQQLGFPQVEATRLQQIQRDLGQHAAEIAALAEPIVGKRRSKPPAEAVVMAYLEEYGSKLFGHPVQSDDSGRIVAVMDRTNNPSEHFFSRANQRLRRRLGRKHLGHDLEQQPAQVALVSNLSHPDYVRILCGSLDDLPDEFARLDAEGHSPRALDRTNRNSSLVKCIRALIRSDEHASSIAPPAGVPMPSQPQTGASATVR